MKILKFIQYFEWSIWSYILKYPLAIYQRKHFCPKCDNVWPWESKSRQKILHAPKAFHLFNCYFGKYQKGSFTIYVESREVRYVLHSFQNIGEVSISGLDIFVSQWNVKLQTVYVDLTLPKVLCTPHYGNSHLETAVCKWGASH